MPMMHKSVSLEYALECCGTPTEEVRSVHQSAVHLLLDEGHQNARDNEPADNLQDEHHIPNDKAPVSRYSRYGPTSPSSLVALNGRLLRPAPGWSSRSRRMGELLDASDDLRKQALSQHFCEAGRIASPMANEGNVQISPRLVAYPPGTGRRVMKSLRVVSAIGLAALLILTGAPGLSQTPKPGGSLTLRLREDLPHGFAINESPTISTMWPAMPCLSNLVLFDPMKPMHSVETIIPELAERWSWQDGYRKLVFFLRSGVKWHDGKPFSATDVKATFDLLRETPDAPGKLRLNPRREWWANVEAVEAPDPQTVVFRLHRPQPSLLLLLASGYTPIYAAHVPPASYRTGCVGTGPFKLNEWRTGEFVTYGS